MSRCACLGGCVLKVDFGGRIRSVLRHVRNKVFGNHEKLRQADKKLAKDLSSLEKKLSTHIAALQAKLAEVERLASPGRLLALERLFTENPAWATPHGKPEEVSLPSPAVSIIMATRNRAHSLAGAIESARALRFTNWELIIVDDGSTDDTKAVVARFTDDARIRYERQPARGAARARNHGLSLARGAFIAYLDSDNLFFPDFIGAAVDALTSDPDADIVYGALFSEHHGLKDTRVLWEPFSRTKLLQKNFIDLNTVMHRRELFERLGGLDESLPRLQDWDLILRYTASTPAKPLPVLAARYGVADEARITLFSALLSSSERL